MADLAKEDVAVRRHWFFRLWDARWFCLVRGSMALGFAAVSAYSALTWGQVGETRGGEQVIDPVQLEHRLSMLESEIKALSDDWEDEKLMNRIQVLLMTGLGAEAGVRLIRGKRGSNG